MNDVVSHSPVIAESEGELAYPANLDSLQAFSGSLLQFFFEQGRSPRTAEERMTLRFPLEPAARRRCVTICNSDEKLNKIILDELAKRYLRESVGSIAATEVFASIGISSQACKQLFNGRLGDLHLHATRYLKITIAKHINKKDLSDYSAINKSLLKKGIPLFHCYPFYLIGNPELFLGDTVAVVLPQILRSERQRGIKRKIIDAIKKEIIFGFEDEIGDASKRRAICGELSMHRIFLAEKMNENQQTTWVNAVYQSFDSWGHAVEVAYKELYAEVKENRSLHQAAPK